MKILYFKYSIKKEKIIDQKSFDKIRLTIYYKYNGHYLSWKYHLNAKVRILTLIYQINNHNGILNNLISHSNILMLKWD